MVSENWPRESAVEEFVKKSLVNKGYKIVPKHRRKKKERGPGIDIQAYKKTKKGNYSSSYFIECKGKTKSTYVTSNEVFGQIFKRMKKRVYSPQVFVIAFPDIKEFRSELGKIPNIVYKKLSKELNLKIWLVDKEGSIKKYRKD